MTRNAPVAAGAASRLRRRVPIRTCIGCRETNPKRQLARIVRTPDGRLEIDATGRSPGRGAYICAQRSCWEKALRGSTIGHALRFSPRADDLEALRAYCGSLPQEESESI